MPKSSPRVCWSRWLFVVSLWASGCTDLPAIESGVCGNGLVDQGEDCDSFQPDAGLSCRAKGAIGACHFSCARDSEGSRSPCPKAWGCDANDICRKPTGQFEVLPTVVVVGGANSLLSGDFDGDGRDDLVTRPLLDRVGRAPLAFHYFDRLGGLSQTVAFPKNVLSPVAVDLTGDLRHDLVFSGFDVGLLLGRVDRSWVPETFSSYVLPDSLVRTLNVYDQGLHSESGDAVDSALVVLTSKGTNASLMVLDTALARLVPRGTLPGPLSELAGQPISANVLEAIDSPCDEVVFAYRGASSFELVDLCKLGGIPGTVSWRPEAVRRTIALDPPAVIDGGPLFTDLNTDGHLDVLLGASGRPYVAYGDGASLATAVPYTLPPRMGGSSISAPMPLATGDLTGDGQVDFVLDDSVVTSWRGPGEPSHHYETPQINDRGRWTVAVIADLNGNGHPDVVAASNTISGIDFFNGTGDRQLISARLATSGRVLHLAVGDFDGDLLNDIVYVEAAPSAEERETLMIAFGVRDGSPSKAVPVARLRHTEQLLSYREESIDGLVVTSTQIVNGVPASTVTPLDGSSDRIPYSAMALISFASNESFQFFPALTLVAGSFVSTQQLDVIALTTLPNETSFSWQLWRVPAFAGGANAPERLAFELDPRLRPGINEGGLATIRVSSASADLDADGLAEFLVVAPADDGDVHCGIERFAGNGQPTFAVSSRGLLVVDEPCSEPALSAVDLNGDGALDLALLTGSTPENHKLFVFWNDRSGNFGQAQQVSAASDSPRAFSTLPKTAERPFATLVYATEKTLSFVAPAANGGATMPPPLTLVRGTGVIVADVDGDGVDDLAAIDAGDLKVFRAALRPL